MKDKKIRNQSASIWVALSLLALSLPGAARASGTLEDDLPRVLSLRTKWQILASLRALIPLRNDTLGPEETVAYNGLADRPDLGGLSSSVLFSAHRLSLSWCQRRSVEEGASLHLGERIFSVRGQDQTAPDFTARLTHRLYGRDPVADEVNGVAQFYAAMTSPEMEIAACGLLLSSPEILLELE